MRRCRRFANNSASIISVSQAQANQTSAQASINQDLTARTDAGTVSGQFLMGATSSAAGVSVRIAAYVKTDRYGAPFYGGWFLDALPNGAARFVDDANFFALTANGGLTYLF
ncbi:hypothetical protein [Methylorubrum extorquens]|uniref:Porin n=1 Tax=Methylorubrum extorquens (strain CM4 / NCIMB 13688) TaxID=440085 RepID=B7KXQ2_METC4|nr:hypothetical protein [Methylorubrum extorquens]ACK84654.1 hypothetical protein Mchl_3838 [Methylorubrum extorquens CM4]